MKKSIYLGLIFLLFAGVAFAGKLIVVTESSILTGITLVNKDGVEIGYCVATSQEKFECDIQIEGIPSYIYDGGETPPDPPPWKATKENADTASCARCHKDNDSEYKFKNWKDRLHEDKDHKKLMCSACHIKS